jgi:hypothetical protein
MIGKGNSQIRLVSGARIFLFLVCTVQIGSDAPAKLVSNTYRKIYPFIFKNTCVWILPFPYQVQKWRMNGTVFPLPSMLEVITLNETLFLYNFI